MKEQSYNVDRDKDHKSLTTKSNLIDLTKECHNELTLGEIVAKVSSQYWKPPIFYDDDDDDDEESSIPLRDIISELPLSVAITPDLPIMDSLIMEDEHLNTILEMESDKEIKSSVKDLNLTPSESEDLSDKESECDMPVCDDSSSNYCLLICA
ncbi:hypothetical protein Tco_1100406 [Tanacetum coccineum]